MKILSLDLSSSTGFAVLDSEAPAKPVEFGIVKLEKTAKEYAPHPWGYLLAAQDMTGRLLDIIERVNPDKIVVEEVNSARARFSQKYLDYIHCILLMSMPSNMRDRVVFINTSDWRRTMGVQMTKEDKNQNARLSRNKRNAALHGTKLDKKVLGIRGKITIKHVAIRRANEVFSLSLIAKDDDIADALLLNAAFLAGCPICTGKD
jgi:hypothetical protein